MNVTNFISAAINAPVIDDWQVATRTVRDLNIEGQPPLVFLRDVKVSLSRMDTHDLWYAGISELGVRKGDNDPRYALIRLARSLREETKKLIRSYTCDLAVVDRRRKQLLLGVVDVVLSNLDAPAPEARWVCGVLHREEDGIWIHTEDYGRFRVLNEEPIDGRPRLAKIKTDLYGLPVGPVLQMEPGFQGKEEDLFDAWEKRGEPA